MGYLAARLSTDQPDHAKREALVSEAKGHILARCSPYRIYVFGSVLREDFSFASDIDIAVVFQSKSEKDQARMALYSAPPLLDWPYDLLIFDREEFTHKAAEGGVCQVIVETGRLVHDQRPEV